jgi:hypothetical protein
MTDSQQYHKRQSSQQNRDAAEVEKKQVQINEASLHAEDAGSK